MHIIYPLFFSLLLFTLCHCELVARVSFDQGTTTIADSGYCTPPPSPGATISVNSNDATSISNDPLCLLDTCLLANENEWTGNLNDRATGWSDLGTFQVMDLDSSLYGGISNGSSGFREFSFVAWINRQSPSTFSDGTNKRQWIIWKDDFFWLRFNGPNSASRQLRLQARFEYADSSSKAPSSSNGPDFGGQITWDGTGWAMITVVHGFQGGTIRIYVNDSLVNVPTPVEDKDLKFVPSNVWRAGNDGGNDGFKGLIDEMFFFNHALSLDEIQDLLTLSYVGAPDPFIIVDGLDIVNGTTNGTANGTTIYQVTAFESFSIGINDSSFVRATSWSADSTQDCSDSFTFSSPNNQNTTVTAGDTLGTFNIYVCTHDQVGIARTSLVQIRINPAPPEILQVNYVNETSAFAGEALSLEVSFQGTPTPSVQWQYFDTNITTTTNDTNTTGTNRSSTLRLPPRSSSMMTTYPLSPYGNILTPIYCSYPSHMDECDDGHLRRRGPPSNDTNTTTTGQWVSFNVATSNDPTFTYTPTLDDDGLQVRAVITNILDQLETSPTTLRITNAPVPPIESEDGGSNDPLDYAIALGAPAGAMGGLLILACCVIITCCLCCVMMIIVAIGFARRITWGEESDWITISPPDYQRVAYGDWTSPMFSVSSKHKSVHEELESILVSNMSVVSPYIFLASAESGSMDNIIMAMLNLMDKHHLAYNLVSNQISFEVDQTDDDDLPFQRNAPSTRLFSRLVKIYGVEWLFQSFAAMIHKLDNDINIAEETQMKDATMMDGSIASSTGAFATIDMMSMTSIGASTKLDMDDSQNAGDDLIGVMQLQLRAQEVLKVVLSRGAKCAPEIRRILSDIMSEVGRAGHSEETSYISVGIFFFLRYICPCLTAPQSFGLTDKPLNILTTRTLLMIAKLIQNLANNTLPGDKDENMEACNAFVIRNVPKLKEFYGFLDRNPPKVEDRDTNEPVVVENSLSFLHGFFESDAMETLFTLAEKGGPMVEEVLQQIENIIEDNPAPTRK